MVKFFRIGLFIFFAQSLHLFALETDAGLSADQIVDKALEQARRTRSNPAQYTFIRATEKQEIDVKGRIKEHKKRSYEMLLQSGSLSRRRVADGPGESVPQEFKAVDRPDYLNMLKPELMSKYVFTLVGKTNINGRPTFQIAFCPRQKNLPAKELMDRVLNQATGNFWVDAEEFELAQAHVRVDSEVTVGAGLLGSLKRAVFVLERTRLPDGTWFDLSTKSDYEARKLAETSRVITKSVSSNFRKLEG